MKTILDKISFKKKLKIAIFSISFAIIVPIIILFTCLFLASAGHFDTPSNKMPSFSILENPPTNLATEIISSDGVVLGTYFLENRREVTYNQISNNTINALVATEDERFYNHSGIDFKSTLRAIIYFGSKGGGSTLTQQLAKMLFSKKAFIKLKLI